MLYIIGGKFKKRGLVTPKTLLVRPTTSQLRETLFNICQLEIEGARFLDLFAGSGAMGLEALSRGAYHATFVEKNRLAQKAIETNIATLAVTNQITLYKCDVFQAIELFSPHSFDLIYIDPPYGEGFSAPLLSLIDQKRILDPSGSLFIEDAPFHEPPLTHLILHSQRKIGRAHLFEYHTKTGTN